MNKYQEVFVGTGNKNKIKEINEILKSKGIFDVKLLCPSDFNCEDEPIENGLTFKENAYIKAKFYYDKYHLPTLAEDSGISIDYFNDYPGVYSARFCSSLNYTEKNNTILNMLDGVKNRKAHYTCVACFICDDRISYYEGKFEGEISRYQKEGYGFGYDPIFYLPEYKKNVSELENVKNNIGHRFQAISKWVNDIYEKNN